MSTLANIDKAILSIEWILKDRQRIVDEMGRRVELNENQKIYIGKETELIKNVKLLIAACKVDFNKNLGKLPPQELDLEVAVLGALILEKPAQVVFGFLRVEHFYTDAHQEIYKACLSLRDKQEPVDMLSLVSELRSIGSLEKTGGAFYIAELSSKVCQSVNIEYHARILIERAVSRKLVTMAGNVLHRGYDLSQDCFELLDYADQQLNEVKEWTKK